MNLSLGQVLYTLGDAPPIYRRHNGLNWEIKACLITEHLLYKYVYKHLLIYDNYPLRWILEPDCTTMKAQH